MQAILSPPFAVAAVLLVLAGIRKLASPAGIVAALDRLGVRWPSPSARAVGVGEAMLGAGALLAPGTASAAACAGAYALFALALVRLRGADGAGLDCGCFGASAPISVAGRAGKRIQIALDALASVVCAAAAAHPPHGIAWLLERSPLQALTLAIGLTASVYCAYLCFTLLPGAWSSYAGRQRG
jgi:uncharacterized membrane protein YphA (DoxX/SURF4 family)